MYFVTPDKDVWIFFDAEGINFNCGITEIGNFTFSDKIKQLTKHKFKKLATQFEKCLLAVQIEDFPTGYALQDRREAQHYFSHWIEPEPKVLDPCGIIIFSDVVKKDVRNAYTLGAAMPNTLQGAPAYNPNSGNTIQLFELTKGK